MESKKHAIITGAASGLGRALAVEVASKGWHVAVCDLNDAGSHETLELAEKAGGSGQVEHLDVTKPEAWQALAERLKGSWPALDLLVNNAGVGVGGEIDKLSLDDWHWIVNINFWGAIYGCHALVDWMKQNPRGAHIVNIASMAGVVSPPAMAPYNVTKAAMISLSETLHGELKPYNIGATVVCPSFFQTNILNNGRFQNEKMRQAAAQLMAASPVTASDVARKILRRRAQRTVRLRAAQATIFWRLKRLMPRFTLNLIASRNAREQRAAKN